MLVGMGNGIGLVLEDMDLENDEKINCWKVELYY